jgi:hypothetical protein
MDGFSLHWRSAPLRRTVNYRVGSSSGSPNKSARSYGQLTGGQAELNHVPTIAFVSLIAAALIAEELLDISVGMIGD